MIRVIRVGAHNHFSVEVGVCHIVCGIELTGKYLLDYQYDPYISWTRCVMRGWMDTDVKTKILALKQERNLTMFQFLHCRST